MAESASRPRLGDILMRLCLVNDEQVQAALDHQAKSGKLFGESLLELGYVGQDDLSWALSSQLGLPYVAVTPAMVDPDLLAQFPADFLTKNLVVPLVSSDALLSVVLADPTDKTILARLELMSKRELNIAVGTPAAIRSTLAAFIAGPIEDTANVSVTPLPARTPPPSLSTPEMATLVDKALTRGASTVHLDPDGEGVCVRFRDASGALLDGETAPADLLDDLVQGLTNWLGQGTMKAPGISVWGETPEQAENLPFRVVAMRSSLGTSLTLHLEGIAAARTETAAGYGAEWDRLDAMFRRRAGMVIGVTARPQSAGILLARMLDHFQLGNRRACAIVNEEFPLPEGVLRFAEEPTLYTMRELARLEGVDVLLGTFETTEVLTDLLEAAERDRLVVATFPGTGALPFLARIREEGVSATLLSGAVMALIGQRILPAHEDQMSRAVCETLYVDGPIRRALQNGGGMEAIRIAAKEQGFIEIATRVRTLTSVDPTVVADLDRHRYLEDAA
jgi:type II secretion system (T2SS) protein E